MSWSVVLVRTCYILVAWSFATFFTDSYPTLPFIILSQYTSSSLIQSLILDAPHSLLTSALSSIPLWKLASTSTSATTSHTAHKPSLIDIASSHREKSYDFFLAIRYPIYQHSVAADCFRAYCCRAISLPDRPKRNLRFASTEDIPVAIAECIASRLVKIRYLRAPISQLPGHT